MTITEIVNIFDAKKSGNAWIAHCPSHSDKTPSLSIAEGTDGRVLIKCHAGCTIEKICADMRINLSDLFVKQLPAPQPTVAPLRKIVATYDYMDADNKLLFQVCRYVPKDFRQRRPNPENPETWLWNMQGVERVLYHLPQVIAAVKEGKQIFICEGEKAVHAAESIGLVATCSGGACKWQDNYTQTLSGADVIILPDNDDPGRKHAKLVAKELSTVVKSVRIVELPNLPEKGDIHDFVESHDAQEPQEIKDEIIKLIPPLSITIQPATINLMSSLLINHELPKIVDAESLTSESIQEPDQVIEGVLHRGSKAVFGGPSKAFKSWTLLDLCLAVSTGSDWLGFTTTPGKVLYINFELQKFAVTKRIKAIAESRDCEINKNFHVWNLRGFSRPLSQLIPELLKQIEGEEYSLIIPDPIYKTLSGRNENDAGDIGAVCNEIESMAVQTGAAVAFGAHFAKGNASGKEHIDRVSGSGVWARDPDSIITATSHEMEGCFSVEMTLRNFPPPEPFVIRWEYPQMRRDDNLDPKALKQPRNGRTPEHSVSDILEHLSEPMTVSTWQKACKSEAGISEASFYRRFKEAKFNREVEKSGNLWHVVS